MGTIPSNPVQQSNIKSSSSTSNPVLDKLSQFIDQSAMQELIETYILRTEGHLEKAKVSVQQNDTTGLKMALHTMKGSSANLGLGELSKLCSKTESAADAGADWEWIEGQLNEIFILYKEGCDSLRQYLLIRY